MGITTSGQTRATILLALLMSILGARVGLAEINGFTVNKIEGVGDLEGMLDSRLTDDFKINYQDCLLYLDGYAGDSADTDSTGDTVSSGTSSGITPRILLKWSMTTVTGYDYSIKVGNCSETGEINDEETDSCIYLVNPTSLTSYTNNEIYIDLPDLLGDSCTKGDTGDSAIYFFIQWEDDTTTKKVEVVRFDWDYEAPAAPSNLALEPGEQNLKLTWEDESNSEDVTYKVYWSDIQFSSGSDSGVKSKDEIAIMDYQISDLELGKTYFASVAAVDDFDNESTLPEILSGEPVNVSDLWETYQQAGGGEEGGFCFVATAAWGSPMDGQVVVLRMLRDRFLLKTAMGRAFVDAYYTHGPILASFIKDKPVLRAAARLVLWPLVALSWLVFASSTGAKVLVLGLLAALSGLFLARRIIRKRRVTA